MRHDSKGQSLIEVLIAIAIAMIISVALINLVVSATKDAQHAKNIARASKIATEGVEFVRTVRDRQGWGDGTTGFSAYGNNTTSSCNPLLLGQCFNSVNTTSWILTGSGGTGETVENIFTRSYVICHTHDPAAASCPTVTNNPCESVVNVLVRWEETSGIQEAKSTVKLTDWSCQSP